MSWISKLFKKEIQKAVKIQAALVHVGYNRLVFSQIDAASLFKKAYEENIIYYSVIDRICEKFGHLPRYVYNKTDKKNRKGSLRTKGSEENRTDGELMDLLLRPNQSQGQDQFFYLCGISYKTTGETIIWKNRGGIDGAPVELYVLPPWLVSVVPDGTLYGIKEYTLKLNGQEIVFPASDIIHWKKPSLSINTSTWDHLRGFNPLVPQKSTIQQANDIEDAAGAMYQNGGARGVLYNKDLADLDEVQNAKLDNVIDRKINSGQKKSAVVQVQGEWGFLDMGGTSVDMQLIEADEKLIEKICFALGFPPELYRSDSTFANKEQAFIFFITNTLMPMAASFDGELTRGLAEDFPEADFIQTDFEELPEMQKQRLERVKALKEIGWLTPNQILESGGWEKSTLPEMDMVWIPGGLIPINEASIKDDGDES